MRRCQAPRKFPEQPYGDRNCCWGCGLPATSAAVLVYEGVADSYNHFPHMMPPLCDYCRQIYAR